MTPEEYMEAISISGIQLAEALCDVTPCGQSSKRIKKSVDRTLKHLDRCIEIKQSNEVFQMLVVNVLQPVSNMYFLFFVE